MNDSGHSPRSDVTAEVGDDGGSEADPRSERAGPKSDGPDAVEVGATEHETRHGSASEAREPGPDRSFSRHDRSTEHKYPVPQDRQGEPEPHRFSRLTRFARSALKALATTAILGFAVLAALIVWHYYVTAPWTRDGRVRVQVASIAPQISGQITELRVLDNQFVHKGDVLYVIDPFDFQEAVNQAKAQVKTRAADLQVKTVQAERRLHLSDLATTPEEQQQYTGNAAQAQGAFESAQSQLAQAEINLKRTEVRSTVNGFITNLLLRVGDYAHEGMSNVSVIDADSYWVDGYFEETKMAHVCVGDRAEAQLMGYPHPIVGQVQSVTRGISVSDAAPSTQGLPNVDAVYTWVRLAQRVPVRIRIIDVPAGVPLVSGMTATVTIRNPAVEHQDMGQRLRDVWARLGGFLQHPFQQSQPLEACVPTLGDQNGTTVVLPTPEPALGLAPNQINPGLTPGMALPPTPR